MPKHSAVHDSWQLVTTISMQLGLHLAASWAWVVVAAAIGASSMGAWIDEAYLYSSNDAGFIDGGDSFDCHHHVLSDYDHHIVSDYGDDLRHDDCFNDHQLLCGPCCCDDMHVDPVT